jgi:hypothetical protein
MSAHLELMKTFHPASFSYINIRLDYYWSFNKRSFAPNICHSVADMTQNTGVKNGFIYTQVINLELIRDTEEQELSLLTEAHKGLIIQALLSSSDQAALR